MVRTLIATACQLALLCCGCGRAVPLQDEADSGASPQASAPVDASLSSCAEGRWHCAGELCRLVGGSEGLPPARNDWSCERQWLPDEDGLWDCDGRAQWVCHGRLTRDVLRKAGRCGWHCAPDPERTVDRVHCRRELTDHDTPPGASPYPYCLCAQSIGEGSAGCARCEKNSRIGTICQLQRW
jgi:hypothetical protein